MRNLTKYFLSLRIYILLIFYFLLAASTVFGQGEANTWYFGNGAGLNFNTNPPSVLENGNANLTAANREGVGSMSDAAGNLLFYTDGRAVYDNNHTQMPNGFGLLGGDGSSTQSGLCLAVNGSTTQYFVISTNNSGSASYYSIVDMTANAGLGDVTTKNSALVVANCSEGVVAIPEYNAMNNPTGENWIIFHDNNSATYWVYKSSGATIASVASYTVGFAVPGQPALLLKTNACFNRIAFSIYNSGRVEVLPFNNTTGVISAPSLVLSGTGGNPFLNPEVFGIEFSPNDRFLYVTESGLNNRKTVYQFDISLGTGVNPAPVLASKSFFTGDGTVVRFGHLQLGPNGKIYVPGYNTTTPTYISEIPTPDVAWTIPTPTATEFVFKKFSYSIKLVGEGLPVFSQDLLRALKIYYNNACEGGATSFSYIFGGSAISQSWDFGDPGSGVLNTSAAASPNHVYATAGTYTVNLSVVDNCGRTRTESVNVIVKTGPTVTIPATTCANTNITLTGTGVNAANYTWSNNSNGLPVIQTGSTYVYNGALPKTIYVQDPTPLATYTVGHTSMPDCFAPTAGNVFFEVFTNITLASFQLQCRAAPGAANVSIQNDLGTITYWGPVAAPVAANALLTMNPNVILAPGKYRFFTSNASGSFCRNQFINPDGGRDVAGVIDVTGENNGLRGGSFFNIGVSLPDPCGIRAYTITDNCPLPVTLIEFSGFKSGNVSQLHWVTSSEINSDRFVVQRSSDGIHYSDLRSVKAAGNSDITMTYSVIDNAPLAGTNYYRLLQYDIDGKINMMDKVVVIHMESVNITVAPNPFNQETNIVFSENIKARIRVLDMPGRVVSEYDKNENQNSIYVGSGLSAGSYVLHIITDSGACNFVIIKE